MRRREKRYLAVLMAYSMIMAAVPFDVVTVSASEIPWEQVAETDEVSANQKEMRGDASYSLGMAEYGPVAME